MSIFGRIRDSIFGRRPQQPAPTTAGVGMGAPQGQPQTTPLQPTAAGSGMGAATGAFTAEPVDVEEVLKEIEREKGNPDLNWRTSIVDLMKLLDLDSSLANRQELATELGYSGQKNGSAEMNMWLHRKVMDELESSGGRVPDSLKG